jgi:hypothetical protein
MVSPNTPSSSQTIIDNFLLGNYQTTNSKNPYLVPVKSYTPSTNTTIPDCGALYPNENRIYDPLSSSCVIVPEEEISNNNDNNRTPFVKNITDGVIDGYERVLSDSPIGMNDALNSMQMMELENRFGPEMASQMGLMNQEYLGRGIQYNPTTGRYIAASPTGPKLYPFDEMSWGTALGDARRAFDSTLGGFGNMGTGIFNAAKGYLSNGGLLGVLANAFSPKTSTNTNRSQGGSTTNVGLLNNLSASSGGADIAEPTQNGNSFPSSYGGVYQNTPSAKKDRTPTPTPKKVQINAPAFKGMGYMKGR